MLKAFCEDGRLKIFADDRNDPNVDHCASHLSPYTHFGQVSPTTTRAGSPNQGVLKLQHPLP